MLTYWAMAQYDPTIAGPPSEDHLAQLHDHIAMVSRPQPPAQATALLVLLSLFPGALLSLVWDVIALVPPQQWQDEAGKNGAVLAVTLANAKVQDSVKHGRPTIAADLATAMDMLFPSDAPGFSPAVHLVRTQDDAVRKAGLLSLRRLVTTLLNTQAVHKKSFENDSLYVCAVEMADAYECGKRVDVQVYADLLQTVRPLETDAYGIACPVRLLHFFFGCAGRAKEDTEHALERLSVDRPDYLFFSTQTLHSHDYGRDGIGHCAKSMQRHGPGLADAVSSRTVLDNVTANKCIAHICFAAVLGACQHADAADHPRLLSRLIQLVMRTKDMDAVLSPYCSADKEPDHGLMPGVVIELARGLMGTASPGSSDSTRKFGATIMRVLQMVVEPSARVGYPVLHGAALDTLVQALVDAERASGAAGPRYRAELRTLVQMLPARCLGRAYPKVALPQEDTLVHLLRLVAKEGSGTCDLVKVLRRTVTDAAMSSFKSMATMAAVLRAFLELTVTASWCGDSEEVEALSKTLLSFSQVATAEADEAEFFKDAVKALGSIEVMLASRVNGPDAPLDPALTAAQIAQCRDAVRKYGYLLGDAEVVQDIADAYDSNAVFASGSTMARFLKTIEDSMDSVEARIANSKAAKKVKSLVDEIVKHRLTPVSSL
jgi:hypothetical protein